MANVLEVQSCMTIQKTFERGAAYTTTEESVYAMMTPILTAMRAQSASLVNQMDDSDAVLTDAENFKGMDSAPSEDTSNPSESPSGTTDKTVSSQESFLSKLKGQWFPEGEEINAFFDSTCIPCGFRLDSAGQVVSAHYKAFGKSILDHWEAWLMSFMRQIQNLLSFFSLPNQYVDICAFIKMLTEFVCVPDLQKILSILMALMNRVSFKFGGIIDLVLGLIGPLIQPFLSGFVDLISKYIMMIVKPIECIIDSLQGLLQKMDYNILFQNVNRLDKHVGVGRATGEKTGSTGKALTDLAQGARKLPLIGIAIPEDAEVDVDLHNASTRTFEADFNLAGPIGEQIKKDNARKQAAVNEAARELRSLRDKGPEGSSPGEVERYREQMDKMKANYQDAKDKRDLSAIGRINKQLESTVTSLKSMIFEFIGILREAVNAVEGFFNKIFDELKKIMGEFIGGNGGMIGMLMKKMALIQYISLISSIISWVRRGMQCNDEDDGPVKIEYFLDQNKGMQVWTDEQGNLHIEENIEAMQEAIDSAIEAIAASSVTPLTTTPADGTTGNLGNTLDTASNPGAVGAGSPSPQLSYVPTSNNPAAVKSGKLLADDPIQKLKSLIEFTGDPVLDTEIARTTEALITPMKKTFKCPLQTSVSQADQINKWIQELNSE